MCDVLKQSASLVVSRDNCSKCSRHTARYNVNAVYTGLFADLPPFHLDLIVCISTLCVRTLCAYPRASTPTENYELASINLPNSSAINREIIEMLYCLQR